MPEVKPKIYPSGSSWAYQEWMDKDSFEREMRENAKKPLTKHYTIWERIKMLIKRTIN